MKTFAVAAVVGVASATSEVESAFMGFITQFGKSYASMDEYAYRFGHFAATHERIMAHNALESTYKLGHNHMSDWSDVEKQNLLLPDW